jgi:hypothetical protein
MTRPSPRRPRPSPRHPRLSPRRPWLSPRHPRPPRVRHCASRRSGARSRLVETGRPRTCNISTEESYPPDRAEARRLARRAKSFVLLGDEKELYHRSPSGILERCISIAEGQELLREIHSGACGHHTTPRALVGNAFRQGFYWPTVVADANRIVRTCEGCQFYARQTHLPA